MIKDEDLLLENLTPANIHHIACEISQRTHDPKDARRLLHKFCELFDNGEPLPHELVMYLRDAFREFLESETNGKKTSLENALGLVPGKKRSSIDDRTAKDIAIHILITRLSGATYENAVASAVGKFGWGNTRIKEIWGQHAWDAFHQHCLELSLLDKSLTKDEQKRAEKILSNITPEYWRGKPD